MMMDDTYQVPLSLTIISLIFLALGLVCSIIVTVDIIVRKGWRSMMPIMIPVYIINALYLGPITMYLYYRYGRAAKPSAAAGSAIAPTHEAEATAAAAPPAKTLSAYTSDSSHASDEKLAISTPNNPQTSCCAPKQASQSSHVDTQIPVAAAAAAAAAKSCCSTTAPIATTTEVPATPAAEEKSCCSTKVVQEKPSCCASTSPVAAAEHKEEKKACCTPNVRERSSSTSSSSAASLSEKAPAAAVKSCCSSKPVAVAPSKPSCCKTEAPLPAPTKSCCKTDADPEKALAAPAQEEEAHGCCSSKAAAAQRPQWATVLAGVSHCGAGCVLGDLVGEWLVYGTGPRINGQMIWAELLIDYAFALLFGIGFQYFSIAPMSGEWGPMTVWRAAKADVASLTAFEIGAFSWMIASQVGIWNYQLGMNTWCYWWQMQVGMAMGAATGFPANWWLLNHKVKEPCC